jgi:hypothetical protein
MVLAVGVLNYLPTALGPAAVCVGMGGAFELLMLAGPEGLVHRMEPVAFVGPLALALVPWVGYGGLHRHLQSASELDRLWLDFRDRFGMVWGQRLREQFNRSAAHAGWPIYLSWKGVRRTPGLAHLDARTHDAMTATMRSLLKRFGPEAELPPGEAFEP